MVLPGWGTQAELECFALCAGFKMIADFGGYHVGTEASLAIVATVLGGGVGLSLLLPLPDADA